MDTIFTITNGHKVSIYGTARKLGFLRRQLFVSTSVLRVRVRKFPETGNNIP